MRKSLIIISLLLASACCATAQPVKTGIDVLQDNGFLQLRGKKIGLVTNPTGVDCHLKSTVDILSAAPGVQLKALFGPEHGVRGDAHAGTKIEGKAVDAKTGVPIYSLYGNVKQPTMEMVRGLDAIVYDIQDIGCRSYTYISTMGGVMKVAAAAGIEMIILDRPNPLGGLKVEGPGVEKGFISFVSRYDIPYIYGLTCGELAQLLNEEGMLTVPTSDGRDSVVRCHLTIVPMEGWNREMSYEDTGLPWVLPSPHIPSPESAYLYPATGILGELGVYSIGVGYTLPFQTIAAKGVDPELLAEKLNSLSLPGLIFRPIVYNPFYGSLKGENIGGVQIFITDLQSAGLSQVQFLTMEIIAKLYPDKAAFKSVDPSKASMFDKVCGSDKIRKQFARRHSFADIVDLWSAGVTEFKELSKKYYLY